MKKKKPKSRNPEAHALTSPLFRQRVKPPKKRKPIREKGAPPPEKE